MRVVLDRRGGWFPPSSGHLRTAVNCDLRVVLIGVEVRRHVGPSRVQSVTCVAQSRVSDVRRPVDVPGPPPSASLPTDHLFSHWSCLPGPAPSPSPRVPEYPPARLLQYRRPRVPAQRGGTGRKPGTVTFRSVTRLSHRPTADREALLSTLGPRANRGPPIGVIRGNTRGHPGDIRGRPESHRVARSRTGSQLINNGIGRVGSDGAGSK